MAIINSETDVAYWKSITHSNEPILYQEYLENFPDGRFVSIAKHRLNPSISKNSENAISKEKTEAPKTEKTRSIIIPNVINLNFATLFGLTIIVTLMAFVFASGKFKFGLDSPFIYIIYVLTGLLAAVVCYGCLDSLGILKGNPYGVAITLGGSIVGLIVVVTGGALYEKYIRLPITSSTFSPRFFLYRGDRSNIARTRAKISLHLGNEVISQQIDNQGSARFHNIPVAWKNKKVGIRLNSHVYEFIHSMHEVELDGSESIYLQVIRK